MSKRPHNTDPKKIHVEPALRPEIKVTVGTESSSGQWGPPGPVGPTGNPGPPLAIKGDAAAVWPPALTPEHGDAWILPDPLPTGTPAGLGFEAGGLAVWNEHDNTWYAVDKVVGPPGRSVQVFGPSDAPPVGVPLYEGDLWLANDPSLFSDTFDPSSIHVTQTPGPQGPAGESALDLWRATVGRPTAPPADFLAAMKGAPGEKGDEGPAGQSLSVSGYVAGYGDLPGVTVSIDTDGDGTADSGTNATPAPPELTVFMVRGGELFVRDSASPNKDANNYVSLGKIAGPPGRAAYITPEVATVADLPTAGSEGQMVHVKSTGELFGWDSEKPDGSGGTGAWVNGGHLGGSGGGLDPGTEQGSMLRWDATAKAWIPGDPSATVPEGTTEGQTITWDAINGEWRVGAPKLANLSDVNEYASNLAQSCVLIWDPGNNEWVDSRSIEIDDITFDASGPGTLLEGIAAYSDAGLNPTKDTWVPSSMAVDKYLREVFGLENLSDCQVLATATDGQVPAWNDTTHRWEPVDQATSPIIYLGTGAWNSSKVNDAADSYGMAAGTVPSPADYPPAPGDQYLDLATGVVTAFTGPASPPSGRTVSTITGGSSPIDLVPNGLGDLIDVEIASTPADGQVLQYVAASSRWEPADPASASPIIYLGTGAWNAANVTSAADNYGMAADTVPSPTDYPPLPGDQYIDLATGVVTAFTGAPGAAPPTKRTAAAITAGASPVDAVPSDIGELRDVTLSSASDKQILQYESATNQWKNVTPDFLNPTNGYTKTEVDTKLTVLATGLEHYESVLSRTNTPPASPATNDLYIVGATPTGLWAGQTNNLARWDGAAWQFEAPKANESHLIESVAETWHWNGTAWVKVATATTTGGPAAAGELWMVGDIKESVLTEPQFKSLLSPAEQLKWALADGRDVTGSAYATTTGRNTIPDLRGAYLRMAGLNNAHTGWNGGTLNGHQEDSTARPRNVFATDHTGGHQHIHNKVEYAEPNVTWDPNAYVNYGTKGWVGQNITTSFEQSALKTKAAGAHTHTITSGGDPETRPKSYSINYFIKIN